MTKPTKAPPRRQPPSDHQFKPGQSGNPAGRPKGSLNKVTRGRFARIFVEEAEREAVGCKGVSAHRAAVRQLLAAAASGDLKAIKLLLPLAAEAEAAVAALDEAAEARAAEAEALARARELDHAAADLLQKDAAEDEALARQLAAADPELYELARKFAPLSDRARWAAHTPKPMRFTDAVAKARTYVALGLDPTINYDPFRVAAALAAQDDGSEDDDV